MPASSNGRGGIVNSDPECGDASACLNLRIPVIRRDRTPLFQRACHRQAWKLLKGIQTGSVRDASVLCR
jgi:hypothetical protein